MSGGDDFGRERKNWRDICMQKIHSTTWKKIENGMLVTTTVDEKGNHKIKYEKIKE